MRTLLRGGWVVGYRDGDHCLYRDGVVVVEDTKVLFVGHSYGKPVDEVVDLSDCIIGPGFIDTHVHMGIRAAHRLLQDAGRQDYFGQPRSHFSIARAGTTIPYEDFELGANYTVAELLRNGITTFVEFGANIGGHAEMAAAVAKQGIRAYVGPGYADIFLSADDEGRTVETVAPERGMALLAEAVEFIKKHDGSCDGRLRGILVPRESDVCTPELLEATRHAASELGVPIACHADYNIAEFFNVVTRYRATPIELLERTGLLGDDLVIGHCNFVAETKVLNYAGGRDLELIAESGATVSHCPINLARRGRSLRDWDAYRSAGVRIALGTDTWPRDMFMQMRNASYQGKILSGSYLAAPAADVFRAATTAGADALGRPDLGRLCADATADLIAVRPTGTRWGSVRDPVKSMVDCAVGDDVVLTMVDGRVLMRDGVLAEADIDDLTRRTFTAAEEFWDRLPEWDPLSQTAEQACPWSFDLMKP